MKVYFITLLFFVTQIHAMEMPKELRIIESKDLLYASGTMMHKELACCYLQESGIDLKEKIVLDIGSKTGEVAHFMAQLTGEYGLVMGIDSDEKKIECANKCYGKQQNLSFHSGCVKTLEPSAHSLKFHVATLFNCFDLIDNKQEACKRIHNCLNSNGEILVNVGPGTEPFDFHVTRAMIEDIPLMKWVPGYSRLEKLLDESYLTEDDYKKIFEESGFNQILLTKKVGTFLFKNKEEFAAMKRPIVMGKSIMQSFPLKMSEWIFNSFIAKFLKMLEKNDDGYYIYPIEEILIYARKK